MFIALRVAIVAYVSQVSKCQQEKILHDQTHRNNVILHNAGQQRKKAQVAAVQ